MKQAFRFEAVDQGFEVLSRGKSLGVIIPAKETSGRHCFYLACDDRKAPRTYRGKVKAAEALQIIHQLTTDAKKKKWSMEKIIVMAWEERPRASDAS